MREITELRNDIYTKHYDQGGGKIRAVIHPEPVHCLNNEGEFEDIDLAVVPEDNWEFSLSSTKNPLRSYFLDTQDPNNPLLVGVESIDENQVSRWVNLKLVSVGELPQYDVNGNESSNALQSIISEVETSVNGNEVIFSGFHPNVEVKYDVLAGKLKESIIINAPLDELSHYSFTFTLKMGGVRLQHSEGELIFVNDETGEKVWGIEPIFAEDSAGNKTYNIATHIHTREYRGNEFEALTIEITDKEFLDNATYPIFIDPTVTQPNRANGYKFTINIPAGNVVTSARARFRGVAKSSDLVLEHYVSATQRREPPSSDITITHTFPASIPSNLIFANKTHVARLDYRWKLGGGNELGSSLTFSNANDSDFLGRSFTAYMSKISFIHYDDGIEWYDAYEQIREIRRNGVKVIGNYSHWARTIDWVSGKLNLSTVYSDLCTSEPKLTVNGSEYAHGGSLANNAYSSWYNILPSIVTGTNNFTINTSYETNVTVEVEYELLVPALKVRVGSTWVVPVSVAHRQSSSWDNGRPVFVRTATEWKRVL